MHYQTSLTGAAVLLALAPSAFAQMGTATVVNSCGFDVYYAAVSGSAEGMTVLPPGGSYSEGYSQPGVGVSIKVAPSDSISGPITQFEFTWADNMISYDISNINGNPFANNGMVLSPSTGSSSSFPTCVPVDCPAGEATCTAAYNQPDDTDTMVCDQSTSLTFDICAGGSAKLRRDPEALPEAHPNVSINHNHHRVHARHILKK